MIPVLKTLPRRFYKGESNAPDFGNDTHSQCNLLLKIAFDKLNLQSVSKAKRGADIDTLIVG
jgi:hypothetical protein